MILVAAGTVACAQNPPIEAQVESSALAADMECWFRGVVESKLQGNAETEFFRKCRVLLTEEIEKQKTSMLEAERKMDAAFRALQARASTDPTEQGVLVLREQRAWAKYREAHCSVEVGRSSWKYSLQYRYARCAEDEANKRTIYLQSLLSSDAG
ncbi:MAG TPA: lysozyme inhibitor LprI family protein [Burkholderiaceae bacterium]